MKRSDLPALDRALTPAVDERPCTRCGERPRWRSGMWCGVCVIDACCRPAFDKGKRCQHARWFDRQRERLAR